MRQKRRKPEPGRVDYFKLMPLTYAVIVIFGGFSLLTILADIVNPISIFEVSEQRDCDQPRYAGHAAGAARAPTEEPPDHGRLGPGRWWCTRLRPVDDHYVDLRRQRDAAADRRVDRVRAARSSGLPSRRRTTPTRWPTIAKKSQIPVIADIHFQPKYVFAAIDAGCAAVRVNPGNIRQFDDKVGEIARAAMAAKTPIRIGVNAGSLDKRLLEKYGKATPEALVESALWECSLFEEHGFRDIKISVKHNDPVVMIKAYRQLAEQCDYPLHLGVTEAGPTFQGTIKSSVAFGALLAEGIGDTIRVSLSAPPVEEIKVGNAILESLGLRERGLEIVSCPSCGRAQVDVYTLAEQVTAALDGFPAPLRVAVMGCVVNGPGEAREADLGVASGNGKGQIFVKGEIIKTVPESQIVDTLVEEALRIADEMGIDMSDLTGAGPSVSVH